MSIASDKRKRAARRDKWRERGECTECGKTPLVMNLDGTQSVKCEKCHGKFVNRRPVKVKSEPAIVDVDPVPLQDTPRFKAYAKQVLAFVKARIGVTQSEINRELQPPSVDWTACAIEWNVDHVEGRQVGCMWKYFYKEARIVKQKPYGYNEGIKASDKTRPFVASIYGNNI